VVLTACTIEQTAWFADNKPKNETEIYDGVEYHHGEFNWYLHKALSKGYTMKKAYDYIKQKDSRHEETPQYYPGSGNLGNTIFLGM